MVTVQLDLFGKPVRFKAVEAVGAPKVINITDSQTPFFVKIDGCINCTAYKEYRKGVALHETMAMCLLVCNAAHSVQNPYIGNHELMAFIKTRKYKDGSPATEETLETAQKILRSRGVDWKQT